MSVIKAPFGHLPDGEEVSLYTITNASGASCTLLDYGATWRSMHVPNRSGALIDVVLGFDTLEEYQRQDWYIGATIGRVANRIGGAHFSLNGEEYFLFANDCGNCSHGGKIGFDKRLWKTAIEEDTVVFSLFSPNDEEGFPGNLSAMVSYRLGEDNALSIRYFAVSDQDTLCSLTNHAYFNLAGQGSGSIVEQTLSIDAEKFTCIDATILPTGEIANVEGTPLDFRAEKPIGQDISSRELLMDAALGYDHNFVLNHPQGGVGLVARAFDPAGGVGLDVLTDQPGVQLFTPYDMCGLSGKDGAVYHGRAGFCLETQHFANAMQHPHFPSIVLKAGDLYMTETIYRFTIA
jgi:aldose 1-epimerase